MGGPGTPPFWRTREEFCTVWNSGDLKNKQPTHTKISILVTGVANPSKSDSVLNSQEFMAGRTGKRNLSRHQKERESQALQEQLDAAMGAATLALGVQEGSHTLNTDVAVIDTSTFTFVEKYSTGNRCPVRTGFRKLCPHELL